MPFWQNVLNLQLEPQQTKIENSRWRSEKRRRKNVHVHLQIGVDHYQIKFNSSHPSERDDQMNEMNAGGFHHYVIFCK